MIISIKHLKGTVRLTRRIHIFHQRYEPLLHSILKPSSASGGDLLQCQLQSVTTGDFYRYKQRGGRPSIPRAVPALCWHQSVPRPWTPHHHAASASSVMRQMGWKDYTPPPQGSWAPRGAHAGGWPLLGPESSFRETASPHGPLCTFTLRNLKKQKCVWITTYTERNVYV